MPTDKRKYPTVPNGAMPDVPYHVNAALRAVDEDVSGLDARLGETAADLSGLDARLGETAADLSGLDARLGETAAGLAGLDARLGETDARIPAAVAESWAGRRPYIIEQVAGRVVKVWDYLNNREQIIYGDTGVRRLANPEDVSTGDFTIRREGSQVTFRGQGITLAKAGNLAMAGMIPSGFRPSGYAAVPSVPYWSSEVSVRARCNGSDLQIVGAAVGAVTNFSATWDTRDPWPGTLPGVPF